MLYKIINNTKKTKRKIYSRPKAKLRYGSSGLKVETLQQALKDQNFYEGVIDGDLVSLR
jgi:peptidoglycan hydrolase-like protein with peptidoglycan-binding domain